VIADGYTYSNLRAIICRAVVWVDEENFGSGSHQYVKDFNINSANASAYNLTKFEYAMKMGTLGNHSIAIESDFGVFTPLGLGISCATNASGGCNATKAQLEILSVLLDDIGGGAIFDGEGGADVEPSCENGVVCAGLMVLDQRLSTSGRDGASTSENNPCTIDSMNAWNVPDLVQPDLQYNSGYFFYHHSEADTVERIDPYQLNQVSAALAVWTYAIAELPTLLPRDATADSNSNAVPSQGINISTVVLVSLFTVIFGVLLIGGVFFVFKNNDSWRNYCLPRHRRTSEFSMLDRNSSHGREGNDLD
jgi:hypothetical protein